MLYLLMNFYRHPRIADALKQIPLRYRPFGLFHEIMIAKGCTKMHLDQRDFASVICSLKKADINGYLYLESGDQFAMERGDFVVLPSSVIEHGNNVRYNINVYY
jgi:hypothetical protein